MDIQLDRIAIWRAKPLDGFTVRESASGRLHEENGKIERTTATTYRFAKNYTVGKGKSAKRYCLIVITYRNEPKEVEAELDRIASVIDSETASKAQSGEITFTDYFIKSKAKES